MYAKKYRLKTPWVFKKALSLPAFYKTPYFAVYSLYHTSPQTALSPQFGLIVSKKIHKRAVRRNRIKRRLRELIRNQLINGAFALHNSSIRAWVIVAREKSLTATYQELSAALDSCVKQLAKR